MNANLLPGARAVSHARHAYDNERGDWRGLDAPVQRDRYAAIGAAIEAQVKRGGRILDVGCGEATLAGYLTGFTYEGIEPSAIAAAHATARGPHRIHCLRAEDFSPTSGASFDAIVFNEMLYYSADPVALLRKFQLYLADTGVFVISIYLKPEPRASFRAWMARLLRLRVTNLDCAQRVRRFLDRGWSLLLHREIPIPGMVPPQFWELWIATPDDRRSIRP